MNSWPNYSRPAITKPKVKCCGRVFGWANYGLGELRKEIAAGSEQADQGEFVDGRETFAKIRRRAPSANPPEYDILWSRAQSRAIGAKSLPIEASGFRRGHRHLLAGNGSGALDAQLAGFKNLGHGGHHVWVELGSGQ